MAKTLLNCSASTIAIMSDISEVEAKQCLELLVDIQLYARQMQFWMARECIPHLANGKVPQVLYPDSKLSRLTMRPGTFGLESGCSRQLKRRRQCCRRPH